jgi:hypothetical protein
VRPVESTRSDPSPVFARLTVADVAWVVFGGVAAVALPPPLPPLPPQAATAKAMSGTAAALPSNALGLVRVMLTPWVGWVALTLAATGGYRITERVVRDRKTS